MTPVRPFDTALFDVDGTLIDSNDAHAETWTQALREHRIATDVATIRSLVGMGGDKLLPRVAHLEEDSPEGRAIAARKRALFSERLPSLRPTRGARDLVQFLRRYDVNLVIATSAGDDEMTALLKQARRRRSLSAACVERRRLGIEAGSGHRARGHAARSCPSEDDSHDRGYAVRRRGRDSRRCADHRPAMRRLLE